MKNKIALLFGVLAVAAFLLGYQQKERKRIITFNVTSRVLYIIQYFLLSAYEGAVLDIVGMVALLFAQKKNTGFVKKHLKIIIIGFNILMIGAGLLVYKNIFSLLPIIGILLHVDALWIDDEKRIRQMSLVGCPFWLSYNFLNGAYPSCIGDFLSIMSILIAMVRYDFKGQDKKSNKN